jgi:methyl halide transferase
MSSSNSVLDEAYWNNRYESNDTGWDLKAVSPPIKLYIDQISDKQISILIPGCGNAYEALYLYQQGFTNITVMDFSAVLIASLTQKFAHTNIKVICQDIFTAKGQHQLILEQTLFCAIDISKRGAYAQKIHQLLCNNGKYVGLFFNKIFEQPGPPFGGRYAEYEQLFTPYFSITTMKTCYNSIKPRQGTELFFIGVKK